MQSREINLSGIKLTEQTGALNCGTDALLLSAYLRKEPKAKALELGAGSGVISLLAVKRGLFSEINAVEIRKEAAEICEKNAAENGFSEKLHTVCADLRELSPELFKGTSVVFSNPPYMKNGEGRSSPEDARQVSRHEVFGGISDFCRFSGKVLKTGGKLYLVYRPDRLESLFSALKGNGFSPKRMTFVCYDTGYTPSSVLCEAVKGGEESLYLTPCLFINRDGKETDEIKEIYENGVFPKSYFAR